jgi:hypothetical protein
MKSPIELKDISNDTHHINTAILEWGVVGYWVQFLFFRFPFFLDPNTGVSLYESCKCIWSCHFQNWRHLKFSVLHHALQPVGLRGGELTGNISIYGISRNIIFCIASLLHLFWVFFFSFSFLYYAAADIVKYLFKEYGAGQQPSPGLLER